MIILKGYETILREDKAELLLGDKKRDEGELYLTNTRLVFETKDGAETSIPLDRIHRTDLTDDGFRVEYAKEGSETSKEQYWVSPKVQSKHWVNDLQKICDKAKQ